MVMPDFSKWEQTEQDILRMSLEASHPRTRERLMALYVIGTGLHTATTCAQLLDRTLHTVLKWVHRYNEAGVEALVYRHTGGRVAQLNEPEQTQILTVMERRAPEEEGLSGHGWTLKKLKVWVSKKLGYTVSRNTLRNLLKRAGFSWKKSKKLLAKAKPAVREAYVAQFERWLDQHRDEELRIVYVDEAHIHQDMNTGYRWSKKGVDDWVPSTSPGLDKRLNWYGAYNFTDGQCFLWEQGWCNGEQTVQFLQALADWLPPSDLQTLIIWDGAPWHSRTLAVQEKAEALGLTLVTLPPYSPDLNPIEGLWKWMREEVTQHYCHLNLAQLKQDCLAFIGQINRQPLNLIQRLWPKCELNNLHEKFLLSY